MSTVSETPVESVDSVVIRFAGDSGDGMQLTGDRFTSDAASFGNDLATLPNYPAEIRAPAGTVLGVSSFQVHFGNHDVMTPGDAPDVLVAMNPAALKANLADLPRGATILINTDEFTKRNLAKVGYDVDPTTDGSLDSYRVHPFALTSLTVEALTESPLTRKEKERAKNMFALGLLSWLYSRPISGTRAYLESKFARKPDILAANLMALEAGWNLGENTEEFAVRFDVAPAPMASGRYRNITGNTATAYGLAVGAQRTGLPLLLGSYPITPATDILHTLSGLKRYGVTTIQAEDEIAGVCIAIGASFGGAVGVTTTSGPGLALKSEAIGLAISAELPLVVVDVQRGGPSTGLPTKTEQSDLLQAMYGRNGEAPVAIITPHTPAQCFESAVEAVRLAVTYRHPVILLTDAYVANGSVPWLVPDVSELPTVDPNLSTAPNAADAAGNPVFHPYKRDEKTLARAWAIPGTEGLEHRIGGIEKADGHGAISYDGANHDKMVRLRAAKVERMADDIGRLEVDDPDGAELLVLGWGSTYGPISAAVRTLRSMGRNVAQAHLYHVSPFPKNTGEVLGNYKRIVMPEMNLGQLKMVLQGKYFADIRSLTKVQGLPFLSSEIVAFVEENLDDLAAAPTAKGDQS